MNIIKTKDNNNNVYKISIIKFNSTARIIYENENANQIKLNIPFSSGGTRFEPVFA